jgi:hypothetical protein
LGLPEHVGYTVLACEDGVWRAERRAVAHDPLPERAYALSVGMPMSPDDPNF